MLRRSRVVLADRVEVLRAQVELPLRTPEIKALVFAQFARFVFAPMAAQFRLSRLHFYLHWLLCFTEPPCDDLAGFPRRLGKSIRMQVFAGPGAELGDNLGGI